MDLLEWYFIVSYCVGGVLVLFAVVVVGVVVWLHRDQCFDRVSKSQRERVRIRRSAMNLGEGSYRPITHSV